MRRALLTCLLCLLSAAPLRAADLLVFAAASLAGPLDQLAQDWQVEIGDQVTISYAGSSSLARQIEAGAPADIVILSSEDWMDHLETVDALRPGTRETLLTNTLVWIGPAHVDDPIGLPDLTETISIGRIALALTEAVPAGIYAREALETLGVWDTLQPHIVEADNVRAATMLVALGAVQHGVVYATDAMAEPRVTVRFAIPDDTHSPIRYPMALTRIASAQAQAFAAFLTTPQARATFTQAGFGTPAP